MLSTPYYYRVFIQSGKLQPQVDIIFECLSCSKLLFVELDFESFECARKTLIDNHLQDHISLIKITDPSDILGFLKDSEEVYDFVMCNPPFYEDELERASCKRFKKDESISEVRLYILNLNQNIFLIFYFRRRCLKPKAISQMVVNLAS